MAKSGPTSVTNSRDPKMQKVYLGKLAQNTTEDSIRKHLVSIGILDDDVQILQLKCRNEKEKSYCVSLSNEDSRCKIFDYQNWPSGIRIRPFRVTDKTFTVEAAQNSSEHNLTSISTTTGSAQLVYVGRVSKDTTEDSLRKHLSSIGISNFDLADIIQLNCRNENEKSFCISVNKRAALKKIMNPLNWPDGLRIRPFIRRNSRDSHRVNNRN